MNFRTEEIGVKILKELEKATEAKISVGYFTPDETILKVLKQVSDLKLIVSEEFSINNPYKLEELRPNAKVRGISPENKSGKLHAKVLHINKEDGSSWGILGSANLTYSGLFKNQEACIELDSFSNSEDENQLKQIELWFDNLWRKSSKINFSQAKNIFDNSFTEERNKNLIKENNSCNYWVIKTPAGPSGTSYWDKFIEEGVISIGRRKINVNPVNASKVEIAEEIEKSYNNDGSRTATKIKKFIDKIKKGDKVLICRGYPANSEVDVHIYGIARVTDNELIDDKNSSWWRFKKNAKFQIFNEYLPKDLVAKSLNKGSLLEVIHNIGESEFNNFTEMLHKETGISVEI